LSPGERPPAPTVSDAAPCSSEEILRREKSAMGVEPRVSRMLPDYTPTYDKE
jgi:hypothetical protein